MDTAEGWNQVLEGTCLFHMVTTDILGYCVFDSVIDLADDAATAAIEAEMQTALNGTGANYTAVSSDVPSSDWFEGACASIALEENVRSENSRGIVTCFYCMSNNICGRWYCYYSFPDLQCYGTVLLVVVLLRH